MRTQLQHHNLHQRCDDRLDGIEVAIRAIGHEKFPQYEIPEYKSDDPRHKKRNQAPEHLEPEFFPPEREVDWKSCASSMACRCHYIRS